MKKNNILKKVGDMSQYAGYSHYSFQSGRGKGTEAFEAYNAAGLRFTVLPDKCLDIFKLSYKGTNIAFISKNGLVANTNLSALDGEFEHYWSAGMLTTCGLENAGPACTDGGLTRVMHGRVHMLPAEQVCAKAVWHEDDYKISFEGEVRQSALWNMNLKLKRRITTGLFDKEILIEDVLENMEPNDEEFMMLYHFNFGYPLMDEGARIVKQKGSIKPRDGQTLDNWDIVQAPEGKGAGNVFFHESKGDRDGYAYVGLINDKLKLGAYIKYSAGTLPILSQWKCPRPHDYVLGLEPSNSYIMGRSEERKNGSLKIIKGYEKINYSVFIGIIEGDDEIKKFERLVNY